MLNREAFDLLRSVLQEGCGLSLQYFPSSGVDLSSIDLGLRANLKSAPILYNQFRGVASALKYGKILLLRDSFLLNTLLLRVAPDRPDFYTVGPFRSAPMTNEDYTALRRSTGLDMPQLEVIKYLYRRVPTNISLTLALTVAKNLLLSFCGFEEPQVEVLELTQSSEIPLQPLENINERSRRVEEAYRHEAKLLSYIAEGNEIRAQEEAAFMARTGVDHRLSNRLFSKRVLSYSVNSLFCRSARSAGVHPLFCDEISEKFARRLELCSSEAEVEEIQIEMVREYCKLCREYATKGYSPNIQRIMQYVQINLGQKLTAENIACALNFSSGYISHIFKEETGQTLSRYIAARRVAVACQLLESTSMTVKEISNYVGIPDWNYFTKVFRKEKGYTPSQYRKQAKH